MVLFVAHLSCSSGKKPIPLKGLRSRIAIEGTVYCRSCNKTLTGAPTLAGAVTRVKCNTTKVPLSVDGKTNNYGYFYISLPKLKLGTMSNHTCFAYLVSSPNAACNKASNLRGGITGSPLTLKAIYPGKYPVAVYSVGPLAFAPTRCPKP
ncbi:hypothetical protein QJS04_geneDACA008354 [Acorus gramineus]|uniref:Uncharacterized protein n=1 Tax=Acorus gramineus TaxID=55184 RepID=A0AAV9AYG9_ACOGR|nr:hypothetical protein QJS04_geneDACA017130 [Acorus gramineus]KAK1269916.1 hypothetical protein QJS04_geneDACA008354 [Acorus gramineus]